MAAKIRSFSSVLKLSFSWPLRTNKLFLSSYYGKGETSCWFRLIPSMKIARSHVVHKPLMRDYHVGTSLGIKAAELTKETPLEKADVGCPICSANITFCYKDVLFLAQFLSPEGNLLNKRITGVCGKQQRKLEKAIKISRRLGLLPKCGPVSPSDASH